MWNRRGDVARVGEEALSNLARLEWTVHQSLFVTALHAVEQASGASTHC